MSRRLDFRQTDDDGGWYPWETVVDGEEDALDLVVLALLETHDLIVGDEAQAVSITAWDGSQIEYVALPRERTPE